MYARVTTYQGRLEDFAWAKDVFVAQMGEKILQMSGCAGILLMIDRTSGQSLSLTLWNDESSLADSRLDASQFRVDAASFSDSIVTDVTEYEVALARVNATHR